MEYTARTNYVRFCDQTSLACSNGGSAHGSTVLLSICLARNKNAAGWLFLLSFQPPAFSLHAACDQITSSS